MNQNPAPKPVPAPKPSTTVKPQDKLIIEQRARHQEIYGDRGVRPGGRR